MVSGIPLLGWTPERLELDELPEHQPLAEVVALELQETPRRPARTACRSEADGMKHASAHSCFRDLTKSFTIDRGRPERGAAAP